MIERGYTNEEQVERIWDREEVTMLLNRHCYLAANGQRREALNTLWVTRPEHRATASLGYNNGYYVGMEEIARHFVLDEDARVRASLASFTAADPALGEDALGLGMVRMDTLTTPLVYLADDGRSARYLGYRLGFQAAGKPDGDADCYLDFGLVFADLLKEDGAWKLWHLVLEHDHTVTVGEHYEDLPVLRDQYTDPLEEQNGTPTIQTPVYQPLFGWEYMWQDMPKPYYTYSETESYGPGGNLGKPYYERERR